MCLRFTERLNQAARECLRALISRDHGTSPGSLPRVMNRIADGATGTQSELWAIAPVLGIAADLDPAGVVVRVDDQNARAGIPREMATASVVWSRVTRTMPSSRLHQTGRVRCWPRGYIDPGRARGLPRADPCACSVPSGSHALCRYRCVHGNIGTLEREVAPIHRRQPVPLRTHSYSGWSGVT